MGIKTLGYTGDVDIDTTRIFQYHESSGYKTPWHHKAGGALGRIPLRLTDDTIRVVSDLSGGWAGPMAQRPGGGSIEYALFGKADEGLENVGAEIGSLVGGFFTGGTVVAKGIQWGQKGIGATRHGGRFFKAVEKSVARIEKSGRLGKAAGWSGRLMADGALRGGVADFMGADVSEEASILKRMEMRSEEVLHGMLWGAGLNLGFGTLGHVWKRMRRFTGDQAKIVKQMAKDVEEVTEALEAGKSVEDILEEQGEGAGVTIIANIDSINKQLAEDTQIDVGDLNTSKPDDFTREEPESFWGEVMDNYSKKTEDFTDADFDELEGNLLETLTKMKDLPSQMQASKVFLLETEQKFLPRINEIYGQILKLFENPNQKDWESVRSNVENIKGSLKAYRLAVQLDAKAGTIAGKTLAARGKGKGKTLDERIKNIRAQDFNKDVEYRGEVNEVFDRIDSLLQTVESISKSDPEDLLSFVRHKRPKEFNIIEAVEKVGKRTSEQLTAIVQGLGKTSKDTIWHKYKRELVKALRRRKKKDGEPILEPGVLLVFTRSIKKRLEKKIKGAQQDKKQKLEALLKEVDSLKTNEGKIGQILKDLKEEGLTDIDNVDQLIKRDIDKLANDLLEHGDDEILTKLGISDELVERLKNRGEEIKLQNKMELEQAEEVKAALKGKQLKELEDLLLEGDTDKIQKYFEDIENSVNSTQKSEVDELIQKRKKELKELTKGEPTIEDVTALLIKDIQGITERLDIAPPTKWEKFWKGLERTRMGMMLFHTKTWLVGNISGMFHLIEQPFTRAVRAYSFIKQHQAAKTGQYENVNAIQYAFAEVRALFYGQDLLHSIKSFLPTLRKGSSAFNDRIQNRFYTEILDIGSDITPKKLASMDKAQRKKFTEIIQRYGTENEAGRNELQKFIQTLQDSDAAEGLGKVFDFFVSLSFRTMGAFDDVYRTFGTMRALRAEAMQRAMVAGKTTKKEIEKFMEDHVKRATSTTDSGHLQWNMLDEFSNVEQLGLAITYQADYADEAFSQMMKKCAEWSRDYTGPHQGLRLMVRQFILPFVKTPTAIAQWMLDKFPASGVMKKWNVGKKLKEQRKAWTAEQDRLRKLQDGNAFERDAKIKELEQAKKDSIDVEIQAKADANADIVTGTFCASAMMGLAYAGLATGSGNHMTREERKMAEQEGWKPFTLRVPGTDFVFAYDRFEPLSTFLSMACDFAAHRDRKAEFKNVGWDDEEGHNMAWTLAGGLSEVIRNKFFLRSVNDIIAVFNYGEPENRKRHVTNLISGYVASYTPRILKDIREITDPYEREAKTWSGKFVQRVMGGTHEGYKRNIFGEKVERQRSREGFIGILAPMGYYGKKANDSLLSDMARMQENFGLTSRHIRSLNGTKVNTRNYLDDKGRSLHDAWLEHMSEFRINKKGLRQTVNTEHTKLYRSGKLPVSSRTGEDSIASRLNDILNTYESKSFSDFIKTEGERFKNIEDGTTVTAPSDQEPLRELLDINPRTST